MTTNPDSTDFAGRRASCGQPVSVLELPIVSSAVDPIRWSEATKHLRLSRKESESVLALMTGASEKEAAARLGVPRRTFHARIERLYKRTGIRSRMEMAVAVFQAMLNR